MKRMTLSERLALIGVIVSSMSLAVAIIGVVGDFTRTVPSAATQEDKADADTAQSLLMSAAREVSTKASEVAEAARAAEAVRNKEAADAAPLVVEVARDIRRRRNSGKLVSAPSIVYDAGSGGYFDSPSGREAALNRGYSGGGAPTYSTLGSPVRQERRISDVSNWPVESFRPARAEPHGYVGRFFRYLGDNLNPLEELFVLGWMLYFGYWIVVGAFNVFMHVPELAGMLFKRIAHIKS